MFGDFQILFADLFHGWRQFSRHWPFSQTIAQLFQLLDQSILCLLQRCQFFRFVRLGLSVERFFFDLLMEFCHLGFGFRDVRSQAVDVVFNTFGLGGQFAIGNLLEAGINHQRSRSRPDFVRFGEWTIISDANAIRHNLPTSQCELSQIEIERVEQVWSAMLFGCQRLHMFNAGRSFQVKLDRTETVIILDFDRLLHDVIGSDQNGILRTAHFEDWRLIGHHYQHS